MTNPNLTASTKQVHIEVAGDDWSLFLDYGKYELSYRNHRLTALRYGEPWRDLVGDNLVFALGSALVSIHQSSSASLTCSGCGNLPHAPRPGLEGAQTIFGGSCPGQGWTYVRDTGSWVRFRKVQMSTLYGKFEGPSQASARPATSCSVEVTDLLTRYHDLTADQRVEFLRRQGDYHRLMASAFPASLTPATAAAPCPATPAPTDPAPPRADPATHSQPPAQELFPGCQWAWSEELRGWVSRRDA